MLLEVTNNNFQIGDTVKVSATGQVGTIVAFEGGRWKVAIQGGSNMLMETHQISRTQALFG